MRRFLRAICTLAFTIMLPGLVSQVHAVEKKVKVFILAGQSNMVAKSAEKGARRSTS